MYFYVKYSGSTQMLTHSLKHLEASSLITPKLVTFQRQAHRILDWRPDIRRSFSPTDLRLLSRRHKAVETGTHITELSSYGEPWVVEHEQVGSRSGVP